MAQFDDAQSDYGSDLDEGDAAQLDALIDLSQANIEPFVPLDLERDERLPVARIPSIADLHSSSTTNPQWSRGVVRPPDSVSFEVQHGRRLDSPTTLVKDGSPGFVQFEAEPTQHKNQHDPRSPLERFRTKPKKPLSVTDLVSPAWCELQYWYNLTRYGRIRRTAAMKRGSEVHKVLEEEVHTTVPVEVQTKEDTWGLRIWNVIQSLRTLRAIGMTRELEVWGVVDGQVINGIIDELSFTCTDEELEASITQAERCGLTHPLPPDQATIAQLLATQGASSLESKMTSPQKPREATQEKVYLTDVKTRASKTLPNTTSMRPTHMQLMLYRKLLSDIATNTVDAQIIFDRYNLDSNEPFSDSLIAQTSGIDYSFGPADADSISELLAHNSLNRIWSLMIAEYNQTLPNGVRSISKVLKTEFRSSKDGTVVGVKMFPHLDHVIDSYIQDEMAWWKGDRETRGVEIEEAFKCQICDFAENCTWRLSQENNAVEASKARSKAGAGSGE